MLSRSPIRKKRPGKPRRGPMRDPQYRKWCTSETCAVCLLMISREEYQNLNPFGCFVVDPAHTENNGASSKGRDSSCLPLGRMHHEEYDAGRKAFEKKYGVDMKFEASRSYARYLEEIQASRERAQ